MLGGVTVTLLLAKAPAPAPVIEALQRLEIECSLDVASALRLRLGLGQTPIGEWDLLAFGALRPFTPLDVRILTGIGVPTAVLNGFVVGQRAVYGEAAAQSAVEITALDASVLMNQQERSMPWPNMPDSAIAAAIFGQYAIVPRASPTTPTLVEPEGTTIQRGTDIRFLRHLARRNGFDCYVQPDPITGADQGHFGAPQPLGIPQAVINVALGEHTNVRDFSVRYEMTRPTTALAGGLDSRTKAPLVGVGAMPVQIPLGLEPAHTRTVPPGIVRPAGAAALNQAEAQRLAQSMVDRSAWALVAEGEVGPEVGVLRPGAPVTVRGVGHTLTGAYLVTKVRHTVTPTGYTQRFEARRNAVEMTGAEPFVEVL